MTRAIFALLGSVTLILVMVLFLPPPNKPALCDVHSAMPFLACGK